MLPNDIPDDWSAEQAWAVYEFLADFQERIWNRYELQLIEILRPDLDPLDADQLDLFDLDDSIPF